MQSVHGSKPDGATLPNPILPGHLERVTPMKSVHLLRLYSNLVNLFADVLTMTLLKSVLVSITYVLAQSVGSLAIHCWYMISDQFHLQSAYGLPSNGNGGTI